MAIKEFTIGPQNYFEEGYFDGDYTQPNVSKSFLQCDIDNFKGFRVITGEYFVDNYIDGTYYHNNTANIFLTCEAMIVTVAQMGLGGYYQDGYYTAGYFTPTTGSAFTLICVTGVDHFGEAAITSSATVTATVGKLIQSASQLVVTVTQVSTISHIEGADLFAFSNAQLTAAVRRIRDNNIAASAVFSVATDASRTRNLSSEDIAVFSAIINGLRSRNVNLNAEAAFSFSASPAGTNSGSAAISSLATLVSNAGKRIVAQAALTSQFTVSASVFDLTERPRQFTQVGSPQFSTSVKKFGTHSYYNVNSTSYVTIPDTNSWSTGTWRTIDCWVYIATDPSQIGGFNQTLFRQFASSTSNQILSIDVASSGIRKIYRFRINAASGSSTVALSYEDTTNGIIGFDNWTHIRVLNDGSSYHLWIAGSKKLLTSSGNTTYISNHNIAAPVEINKNSLPSQYSVPMYMDELLITTSTITGSGTSSFTPPTQAWLPNNDVNQSDILVLNHFDGVFDDDMLIIEIGQAAITSTVTLTATPTKPQGPFIATTLASVSTLSATATKTAGTSTAYLYAIFNLSSEVISSQNGVLLVSSTLVATARKTARITKTLANSIVLSALSNNTAGSITAFLTATSSFTSTPFRADKNPAPIALDNYRLYHLDSPPSTFDGQFLRATYFQERAKFGADAILNPTSGDALGYVPGYYPANGDDFSIEFWHRGRTNSTGLADWKAIATFFGGARWLEFDGNTNRYRIRGLIGQGDPAGFNAGAPGAGYYPRLAYNWSHIVVQRKNDLLTLFVNGVSAGSVSDTSAATAEVSFGTNTNGALSWTATTGAFDEIRINTLEAYYTGNFTPPIAAYATEAQDYYTVESVYALLEPRATVTATAIKLVVTSAALSATSTINAPARKIARTIKTLAVATELLANAGKRVDVVSALGVTATLSATITPTRLFASAIAASTEVNASAQRFRDPTNTSITGQITVSAITGFRKQFTADISSQGGFIIDVVANLAGVALLESQFALTAEPKITRNVPAALAASAGLTVVTGFLKLFDSVQSAEFTQAVTSFIKVPLQFEAAFTTASTATVDYIRYRDDSALLESTATAVIVANKNPDAFVPMTVVSTLSASAERFRDPTATDLATTATETSTAERFRDVIAPLASEFAATATVTRIKPLASALNCEFAVFFLGGRLNDIDLVSPSFATVTASVTKSTDTQAALSSQFASSTGNIRVRFATTAMTTTAAVTASAVKTVDITKTLATVATITAAVRRFRDPNPTAINSQFAVIANGFKDTDITSPMAVLATVVVEISVNKAKQGEAALVVTSTMTTVNQRVRYNSSAFVNAIVLTAPAVKTARPLGNLLVVSTAPVMVSAIKYTGIILVITAQGFVLTAGEVINIDPRLQLVIRPETRMLTITSETRVLLVL